MHTFSSPVKEDDPFFSSPVKEDAITSLTRSVFPREVSFPTKVPSLQQSLAFPMEFLRRLFPQRSYSKTFVSPVDHLLLPSVVMLYYHHMHSLTLHCILGSKMVFYIFKSLRFLSKRRFPIIVSPNRRNLNRGICHTPIFDPKIKSTIVRLSLCILIINQEHHCKALSLIL